MGRPPQEDLRRGRSSLPCGRLQVIAFIAEATVAKRILDHLGLDSRGPPLARAQAPPDALDPAPGYDGTDPVFT